MKKKIWIAFGVGLAFWIGFLGGHSSSPDAYTQKANADLEKQNAWYLTRLDAYESSTKSLCSDLHNADPKQGCTFTEFPGRPTSSLRYLP